MLSRIFLTVEGNKIVHFTYLDSKQALGDMDVSIRYWANQDFGMSDISTEEDAKSLKRAIIQHFKKEFPEISSPDHYDRHGYCRLWLKRHLDNPNYTLGV